LSLPSDYDTSTKITITVPFHILDDPTSQRFLEINPLYLRAVDVHLHGEISIEKLMEYQKII
jgi:hypothetical protein